LAAINAALHATRPYPTNAECGVPGDTGASGAESVASLIIPDTGAEPANCQVSSDHPLCRYPKSDIIHPKVAFGLMGSAAGQYLSYCPATVRRNRCGS